MRKSLWLVILVLLVLATSSTIVYAQDYLFQVPKADVIFLVNADGTASLDYILEFKNEPGAHEIDFVDIGLPNNNYDRATIIADVDGATITNFDPGGYQGSGTGIAVGLGGRAIKAGQSGTVHVYIARIRNILYKADQPENYASIQFSPTWFGSKYVNGKTDYTVTLVLPPGIKENEPKYYPPTSWSGKAEPESGYDDQGRVFYRWHATNANASTQYTFGGGFPAQLVPANAISTKPAFDFGGFISSILDTLCSNIPCLFFCGFILFPVVTAFWGRSEQNKRKLKYLPPKISIEGHGIKRGLTAVQAAVLMETPVDKVMTMILFSVVKKGAATVTSRNPLKLQLPSPLPENLYSYEKDFLDAFRIEDLAQQRRALQNTMIALVKELTEAMKGFSSKETIVYYQEINKRAWEQIKAEGTPEVQMQKLDEAMEWTMLDRDYENQSREVFRSRPVYVPMWWGRYDPGYHPVSTSQSNSPSSGGGSFSMPQLPGSDFAASVVTGVQGFSAGVIGDMAAFTGGITQVTNPPPPPSRSSSRGGGGGHSCACACACAGCACACAGGGR